MSADVLTGWVDPEGDPIYLAGATTTYAAGVVAASPEGRVVFQHTNANAGGAGAAAVSVTVSDSWGAEATKALTVTVLGEPELRVRDLSLTVTAGVTATVDVGGHVSGAVGPLAGERGLAGARRRRGGCRGAVGDRLHVHGD